MLPIQFILYFSTVIYISDIYASISILIIYSSIDMIIYYYSLLLFILSFFHPSFQLYLNMNFYLISQYDYPNQNFFQSFFFIRSEEHTSELQSRFDLVCSLLLEKKNI